MNESMSALRIDLCRPFLAELQRHQLLRLSAVWAQRLLSLPACLDESFDSDLRTAITKYLRRLEGDDFKTKPNTVDSLQNHFLKRRSKLGGKIKEPFWDAIESIIQCFWSSAEMDADWNSAKTHISPIAANLGLTAAHFKRPTQIDLETIRGAARQSISRSSIALGLSERDFLSQLESDCACL